MLYSKFQAVCVRVSSIVFSLVFLIVFSIATPVWAADLSARGSNEKTFEALIYETIIALNNAVRTGNYSVLHALGSSEFQEKFNVKQLAQTYGVLQRKKINLRPLVTFKPVFRETKYHGKQEVLRLRGFMPSKPVRLSFDLAYKYSDGIWRLYAMKFEFSRPDKPAHPGGDKLANWERPQMRR